MAEIEPRPVCPHCGSQMLKMTMDDKGQFVTVCASCGGRA